MRISVEQILEIRLAPPGDRYHRFADKGDAGRFACALAAVPGVGAAVFSGGRYAAAGTIVAILDDNAAAAAAGCGRLLYTLNPPRGESLR